MTTYQRVLVSIHKNNGVTKLAKFTECILTSLGFKENNGMVRCKLRENRLILWPDEENSADPPSNNINNTSTSSILLSHPPFCPILNLTPGITASIPPDILNRGVDVGVVTILETSDTHVLLTRRAKHMRTFPGIWVPPGGHIEEGETLTQAGLRELREETGLEVTDEMTKSNNILCLWESVFPYILSMGQPKRHHIVVYLHVQIHETSSDLQKRINLDRDEVDAAMWLDPILARLVADDRVPDSCPPQIQVLELDAFGEQRIKSLQSSFMTNTAPTSGQDIERVSTGTRYALAQWLLRRATQTS